MFCGSVVALFGWGGCWGEVITRGGGEEFCYIPLFFGAWGGGGEGITTTRGEVYWYIPPIVCAGGGGDGRSHGREGGVLSLVDPVVCVTRRERGNYPHKGGGPVDGSTAQLSSASDVRDERISNHG